MNLFLAISLLLGSFVLNLLLLPKIIGIVKCKQLMDNPNSRSSHQEKTPSLGGVSFFIALIFGFFFLQKHDLELKSMSLIFGVVILFFVGLKDDLVILSPFTKLGAQIFASCMLLTHPHFQITDFHGFLGIHAISLYITLPLSVFLMIFVINAYNLIDGIDGLAAIVGLVIFSTFGTFFYFVDSFLMFGICLVTIGSLTAFLFFNLSSKRKIFMGDTGSLIIGFLIAASAIRLLSISTQNIDDLPFPIENLPIIVAAVLIVPFFDTARIFTIRLLNKKSPFSPDRNHTHHLLIDQMKLSHAKASLLVGVVNILFIALLSIICINQSHLISLICFMLLSLGFAYLFFIIKHPQKHIRRRVYLRQKIRKIKTKSSL